MQNSRYVVPQRTRPRAAQSCSLPHHDRSRPRQTAAATFARARVPLVPRQLPPEPLRGPPPCRLRAQGPSHYTDKQPSNSRVNSYANLGDCTARQRRTRPPNAGTVRLRVADVGARLRTLATSPTAASDHEMPAVRQATRILVEHVFGTRDNDGRMETLPSRMEKRHANHLTTRRVPFEPTVGRWKGQGSVAARLSPLSWANAAAIPQILSGGSV